MSTAEHPYTQMKKQRIKMKFILPCCWYFTYFKVESGVLALLVTLELRNLEDLEIAWSLRRNYADLYVMPGFIDSLEPN